MKLKFLTFISIFSLALAIVFLGAASAVLAAEGIENPLGIDDPREIIGNVIRAILGIVGSLALAIFIFGGFTWITSAGNDEKVKKGKEMITWAAFGLVVIFLSYALVTFVIGAIVGGSGGSPTIPGSGDSSI
ncbi:MAG: hypothetical protein HUU49_03470 [Candidatus Buchananbacteria bacterium]|nr:hypothetical protein [Candidatus Buchananbacteria bacterium]